MTPEEKAAQQFAWIYRRKEFDLSGEKASGAYDGFLAGAKWKERRALEAFRQSCEKYDDGRELCWSGYTCEETHSSRKESFKQKLNDDDC